MVSASDVRLYEIITLTLEHSFARNEIAGVSKGKFTLAVAYLLNQRRTPNVDASMKGVTDNLDIRKYASGVFLVGRDKPIDIPDNGMIVKDGLCLKRIKKLLLDYLRFGTIDIIDTLRVQPKATVNINLRTEVLGDTFAEELAVVVCLESVSVCMSVFAHRLI